MPIHYQIDTKVNCVHQRFTGTLDPREVEGNFGVVFTDPEYLPSMNILQDLRQCDIPDEIDYSVISTELRDMASRIESKMATCRLAIVTKDAQDYAKAHQLLVALRFAKTPVERKAFREIDKAFKWLGIPDNYNIIYSGSD